MISDCRSPARPAARAPNAAFGARGRAGAGRQRSCAPLAVAACSWAQCENARIPGSIVSGDGCEAPARKCFAAISQEQRERGRPILQTYFGALTNLKTREWVVVSSGARALLLVRAWRAPIVLCTKRERALTAYAGAMR
jgi:hypothetical protein